MNDGKNGLSFHAGIFPMYDIIRNLGDFVPKSHIKHVKNIKQSNAVFQKIVHSVNEGSGH